MYYKNNDNSHLTKVGSTYFIKFTVTPMFACNCKNMLLSICTYIFSIFKSFAYG